MQKYDVLVKCWGIWGKYVLEYNLRARSLRRAEKCGQLLATRHGHSPTNEVLVLRDLSA